MPSSPSISSHGSSRLTWYAWTTSSTCQNRRGRDDPAPPRPGEPGSRSHTRISSTCFSRNRSPVPRKATSPLFISCLLFSSTETCSSRLDSVQATPSGRSRTSTWSGTLSIASAHVRRLGRSFPRSIDSWRWREEGGDRGRWILTRRTRRRFFLFSKQKSADSAAERRRAADGGKSRATCVRTRERRKDERLRRGRGSDRLGRAQPPDPLPQPVLQREPRQVEDAPEEVVRGEAPAEYPKVGTGEGHPALRVQGRLQSRVFACHRGRALARGALRTLPRARSR